MSSELVGFILDIAVLVFLSATMIYVLRLTRSLSDFKAHRREFDGVIRNLLSSIDKAERSVHSLKQVSAKEVAELEGLISQSKAMSEELKVINEAGESMAKRLERAAEKNGQISSPSSPLDYRESRATSSKSKSADYASKLKSMKKKATANPDEALADIPKGLHSQAEQELYAALRTNKRNLSGKGGM